MPSNPPLHDEYDLVIVGSGGGAITAALAAKRLGKTAVILEKQDRVGGSTGFSGGVWWVPDNPLLAEAGIADSYVQAKEYFDNVVTYKGPAVTDERRDAFLKAAPRMIAFLRDAGMKIRRPNDDWPDYYDDRPGGLPQGRSLLAEPFNLHELGEWEDHLSVYPPMTVVPMGPDEFPTVFMMKRTLAGKLKAAKFGWLMLKDKLSGRQTVTNGAAIQGRMLQIALRESIEIQRNTPVTSLVVENDKVVGIVASRDGNDVTIRARGGVLVNVGGYAHNTAFRKAHTDGPVSGEWTSANPGDTGEIITAMMDLGAATDCLDSAWWVVTSRNVDGGWPEGATWKDGRVLPFMHHLDLSLPFSILVDQDGRRFADESGSYMEIGERMYARQRETGKAIPAWTIFDQRHRDRYPWGTAQPGKTPAQWLASGYMKKAATLADLAKLCGIDAVGLASEVTRFNAFCASGVDADYARGSRAFDRAHGDPTVKPNPNLGAIEQGPFYAVAIFPGDVGTAGGVVTDEYARVVKDDGGIIPGLYAVGNSAASPFGRSYPGAGASIAAAFTFGLITAYHSAGSNELERLLA